MPKRERDEALSELTSRIFATMLDEVVMDVVLQSHQEIARSRVVCSVCHTRCGSVHVPGPSNSSQQATASSSTLTSPQAEGETQSNNGSSETGTNTPVNTKGDGTIYFDCENCKRSIASNRYATHLSSCLGLGNTRRGATRNATARTKLASEAGRSASPYVASENGHASDEGKITTKGKGKSKAKRTDEAEFSLNRKRTGSPSISPVKKAKKQKTSGSPVARVKSEPDTAQGLPNNLLSVPTAHSHSKIPSKLRETSLLSSRMHDQRSSSPESRFSSPVRSASTPTSTLSAQSPKLSGGNPSAKARPPPKNSKTKPNGVPPPKRASPPRPPPVPVIRMAEPDYLVDVEGDETGSSTDTDSD